jgi:hypothetical protein
MEEIWTPKSQEEGGLHVGGFRGDLLWWYTESYNWDYIRLRLRLVAEAHSSRCHGMLFWSCRGECVIDCAARACGQIQWTG